MKATLTFTLPEEKEEFENACKGSRYAAAIDTIDNIIRNKIKYAPDTVSQEVLDALQEIRTQLNEERQYADES